MCLVVSASITLLHYVWYEPFWYKKKSEKKSGVVGYMERLKSSILGAPVKWAASVSASLGLVWAYFRYNRSVTIAQPPKAPKVPEKRSEPLIIPDPVKKNPGNPIILPILLGISACGSSVLLLLLVHVPVSRRGS